MIDIRRLAILWALALVFSLSAALIWSPAVYRAPGDGRPIVHGNGRPV